MWLQGLSEQAKSADTHVMSFAMSCHICCVGSRTEFAGMQHLGWQSRALLELVCSSLRLREVVASGATSLMSPDTPKSAVRLRVNTAVSEVFMAKV